MNSCNIPAHQLESVVAGRSHAGFRLVTDWGHPLRLAPTSSVAAGECVGETTCVQQAEVREGQSRPVRIWDSRQSPIPPKVNQQKVLHQLAARGLAFSRPETSPTQSRQVIEMNPSCGLQVVVMGVDINSDVRTFLDQGSEAPGSRYQWSCSC